MNTKNILKLLKLNESTISMIMGALVVLVVGWVVISYFRNSNSTPSVTEKAANTQEENQNEPGIYVVSRGDSLWKIAESKFGDGYKWVEIAHANGMTNPDKIEVGQKLTIPTIQAQSEDEEKMAAMNSENTEEVVKAPVKSDKYVVVRGDNLWSIAVKNYGDGYKWVEIAKANNLTNPSVIHAGNEFVLP